MTLDSYTLAAFLSGELPNASRPTVAAALVQDRDAREVLHMACEALAAAMEFESTRQHLTDRASRPVARPGRYSLDRSARASGRA